MTLAEAKPNAALVILGALVMAFLLAASNGEARADSGLRAGAISAGLLSTCAIEEGAGSAGRPVCWGRNDEGQLGDGTTTNRRRPVPVQGLAEVSAIASGGGHRCAIAGPSTPGQVWCWGANGSGQLGNGGDEPIGTSPAPVTGLDSAVAIAAGGDQSCALLADQTVWCWGSNRYGQLGDGTTVDRNEPVQVVDEHQDALVAAGIAAGGNFACALTGNPPGTETPGPARCWGNAESGQLGNGVWGDDESNPVPQAVLGVGADPELEDPPGLNDAVTLAAGFDTACAIRADRSLACWGGNAQGVRRPTTVPLTVPGLANVLKVAVGSTADCAITGSGPAGPALCRGYNFFGELGDGTRRSHSAPAPVLNLADAREVAVGDNHACAIRESGRVVCWGSNFFGELGDGTGRRRLVPVPVGVTGSQLGLARITPRKLRVRAGRKAVVRVRLRNRGGRAAAGVKVCARPRPARILATPRRCLKLGRVAAGAARTARFTVRVKRTARRGRQATLRLNVTAEGLAAGSGRATVRVR